MSSETKTLDKAQSRKILESLKSEIIGFLGGEVVTMSFPKRNKVKNLKTENGGAEGKTENICIGYISFSDGSLFYAQFSRKTLPFSKFEINFLHELFQTITRLGSGTYPSKHQAHFRTSLISSSFDIAVVRSLRGEINNFWSVQQVLRLIKQLTYKKYEGAPCMTAILYTNSGVETLKKLRKHYTVHEPTDTVKIEPNFFDSILTYRYVDGMRSSFIVDNNLKLLGIIEIPNSTSYTSIDFNVHSPFRDPLGKCHGKSFFMFATKKSSIDILTHKEQLIRWRSGRWGHIDYNHLKKYIDPHISSHSISKLLAEVIVSLSNSGHGAVILLPTDRDWRTGISRHVDESAVGNFLRKSRLNRKLGELNELGVLIGMLSSDGMTVIDEAGNICDASALVEVTGKIKAAGGGRTSAAISASKFGTVFKISEDGPIQIYQNKKLQLEIL